MVGFSLSAVAVVLEAFSVCLSASVAQRYRLFPVVLPCLYINIL
jgi:hypothetical protein